MNALLFYITLGLYFLATAAYLAYLVKPKQTLGLAAQWCISAGFVVHLHLYAAAVCPSRTYPHHQSP